MHAVVHALNVHRENAVEIGSRRSFQVANVGNSGIVHEDVNTSLLKHVVKSRLDTVMLGHVTTIGFGVPTTRRDFTCNRFGSVLVDVQDADAGSATSEPLSDCAADAAGPARNYGKFAVKPERVRIPLQKRPPGFDLTLEST